MRRFTILIALALGWTLSACAPRAVIQVDQFPAGITTVRIERPVMRTEFRFLSSNFFEDRFEIYGPVREDPEARELNELFFGEFSDALRAAGLRVLENGAPDRSLELETELALNSRVPLQPNMLCSVTLARWDGQVVGRVLFGEILGYLYGKDKLTRDVARGAAKGLIERIRAAKKKMGSDPVLLQEDSAVVTKQMKPSAAAQLTTKEEVVDHLVAHSPYRGEWVFSGPRGGSRGGMTAGFTKDGGRLNISGTQRYIDGDIKDLAITIEGDKVTVSFKNSTTGALYVLAVKEKGNLVGTASRADGTSDIDLSPTK